MSGTHKYPTISFRISPREREEIEAKIFTSGMKKKDYFVRSCIYNRVCVVGKKETVYQIVERLQEMENRLVELAEQIDGKKPGITLLTDCRRKRRIWGVWNAISAENRCSRQLSGLRPWNGQKRKVNVRNVYLI